MQRLNRVQLGERIATLQEYLLRREREQLIMTGELQTWVTIHESMTDEDIIPIPDQPANNNIIQSDNKIITDSTTNS